MEQEHNRLQHSQNEARMEKTAEVIQALREQLVLSEKRATDYQTQATELRKQLNNSESRERRFREEAELERKNADKREQQLKESSERRERQLKENFDAHREQMRQSQDQREKALRESSTGDRVCPRPACSDPALTHDMNWRDAHGATRTRWRKRCAKRGRTRATCVC